MVQLLYVSVCFPRVICSGVVTCRCLSELSVVCWIQILVISVENNKNDIRACTVHARSNYLNVESLFNDKRGIVTFQVTIMFGLRFVRFLVTILHIVGFFMRD